MKLIYCKACGDIIRLWQTPRHCLCGNSGGYYLDNMIDVEITGPCVPIGICNHQFRVSVDSGERFIAKKGVEFLAFVIPEDASTVIRID